MTLDEAIAILSDMKIDIPVPKAAVTQKKRNVALDMAINALSCSEIPNGSDDTISRQAALDAIDSWRREYPLDLQEPIDDCWNAVRELPAVQPDRDVIDDCLYHIYKNISVHTATGGVIAIKYYMEKLYEEIYGEGKRPWWMK